MEIKQDFLGKARSRYTGTFQRDPAFDLLVKSVIDYEIEIQDQLYDYYDKVFNIDKSSGFLLDLIGKIVGQPRFLIAYDTSEYFGFKGHPLALSFGTTEDPSVGGYWKSASNAEQKFRKMDDETYRIVLKARIKSNNSKGTVNDFLEVVNILTKTTNARVDTNEESGSLELVVGDENLELLQYFYTRIGQTDSILPIPLGVFLTVNIIPIE